MQSFMEYVESRKVKSAWDSWDEDELDWDTDHDPNVWEVDPHRYQSYEKDKIRWNKPTNLRVDKHNQVLRLKWDDAFPSWSGIGNGWIIKDPSQRKESDNPDWWKQDKFGRWLYNVGAEYQIVLDKQAQERQEREKGKYQNFVNNSEQIVSSVGEIDPTKQYRILVTLNPPKMIFQDFRLPHATSYGDYGLGDDYDRKKGTGAFHGFYTPQEIIIRQDDNPNGIPDRIIHNLIQALYNKKLGKPQMKVRWPTERKNMGNRDETHTVGSILGISKEDVVFHKHDAEEENRKKIAPYMNTLYGGQKQNINKAYQNRDANPTNWFQRYPEWLSKRES